MHRHHCQRSLIRAGAPMVALMCLAVAAGDHFDVYDVPANPAWLVALAATTFILAAIVLLILGRPTWRELTAAGVLMKCAASIALFLLWATSSFVVTVLAIVVLGPLADGAFLAVYRRMWAGKGARSW